MSREHKTAGNSGDDNITPQLYRTKVARFSDKVMGQLLCSAQEEKFSEAEEQFINELEKWEPDIDNIEPAKADKKAILYLNGLREYFLQTLSIDEEVSEESKRNVWRFFAGLAINLEDMTVLKCCLNADAAIAQYANFEGFTLLMGAAALGKVSAMILLLEAGADVNAKLPAEAEANARTALQLAATAGKSSAFLCLLEHGAEGCEEALPLALLQRKYDFLIEIIKRYPEYASLTAGEKHRSILQYYVSHDPEPRPANVSLVEELLAVGIDPLMQDIDGLSAIGRSASGKIGIEFELFATFYRDGILESMINHVLLMLDHSQPLDLSVFGVATPLPLSLKNSVFHCLNENHNLLFTQVQGNEQLATRLQPALKRKLMRLNKRKEFMLFALVLLQSKALRSQSTVTSQQGLSPVRYLSLSLISHVLHFLYRPIKDFKSAIRMSNIHKMRDYHANYKPGDGYPRFTLGDEEQVEGEANGETKSTLVMTL
ncbi:MAG: hypothetical protein P1U34_11385 [Coxiellaceae bacterium]|nr:hypothetical protein [Coxiellaceae bacterium]